MDYWKGQHSGTGVETAIPADRKIDGIADVTFQSALSTLKGRKQTALAYKDEVNVFRRTHLYAGPPNTSHWYDVVSPAETVGARAPSTSAAVPVSARANSGGSRRRGSFLPWLTLGC